MTDSIQTYLITPSLSEEQQVHRLSSDSLQVHPPVAADGGGRRQLRDLHLEGDEVGAVETSCPQAEMSHYDVGPHEHYATDMTRTDKRCCSPSR